MDVFWHIRVKYSLVKRRMKFELFLPHFSLKKQSP